MSDAAETALTKHSQEPSSIHWNHEVKVLDHYDSLCGREKLLCTSGDV